LSRNQDPPAGLERCSGAEFVLQQERSLVVVVDMQGRLVDQVHRPHLLRAAVDRLLQISDLFSVPVILTEQYPQGLGPTEAAVQARFDALSTRKEKVEKTSFSCCGEAEFEGAVNRLLPGVSKGERQFIVAGIEAHVCVVQTVLGLLHQGSACHVCWEAVSGRGAEYRSFALQRMAAAGAVMTNHESVGFEWAIDKGHPRFKELNRILREGQVTG
jgi:nicotinamidase-related amidase